MPATSPVRSPAKSAAPRHAGTRSDPVRRRGEVRSPFDLKNKDPKRHYVWAYRGDQTTGADYYLMLGYEPVNWTSDGVRPLGGKLGTIGREIELMGMTLMSIDAEERARIEREGIDGGSGQEMVTERANRINAPRQGHLLRDIAGLRGSSGDPVVQMGKNETSLSEIEVEE